MIHRRIPDHPRSRGVYVIVETLDSGVRGSSPLARGLLAAEPGEVLPRRIIPARAGFTHHGQRLTHARPDHPRSRGVYCKSSTCLLAPPGSSPLARGLQSRVWPHVGRLRIIPARAGFTTFRKPFLVARWDHPRSRGVYHRTHQNWENQPGSSPLARGLLVGTLRRGRGRRIIPARAGFTARRY